MKMKTGSRGILKDSTRGFTLIELIVTLSILAILAAVLIPSFTSLLDDTKASVDTSNLKILNDATTIYRLESGAYGTEDVFSGLTSDGERLNKLLEENYISAIPQPKQNGAAFTWDSGRLIWVLNGSSSGGSSSGGSSSGGSSSGNSSSSQPAPLYTSWNSGQSYDTGSRISYNGANFYARFYCGPGQIPGTLNVGWQEITDQWRPYNVYNTGDVVQYNGAQFRAVNYSYNQTPGMLYNPWQELTDQWRNFNIYNTGDIVWHNGKKYQAKNWNQNSEPGVSGAWNLIG